MTNEELQVIAEAAKEGAFQAVLISQKPWLNIKEAARYLGVSETFVYKACESGRLTCRYAKMDDELKGKMLISKSELDKFPERSKEQVTFNRIVNQRAGDYSDDIVKKIISDEKSKNK